MADDRQYQGDTSILFRPISPAEHFSHPSAKPARPSEAAPPARPGQLYYTAYTPPLAPPAPLAAVELGGDTGTYTPARSGAAAPAITSYESTGTYSPASALTPTAFSSAPFLPTQSLAPAEAAFVPYTPPAVDKLPPYLQKRPNLAHQMQPLDAALASAASAPAGSRITSTFDHSAAEADAPTVVPSAASQPHQRRHSPDRTGSDAPAAEPMPTVYEAPSLPMAYELPAVSSPSPIPSQQMGVSSVVISFSRPANATPAAPVEESAPLVQYIPFMPPKAADEGAIATSADRGALADLTNSGSSFYEHFQDPTSPVLRRTRSYPTGTVDTLSESRHKSHRKRSHSASAHTAYPMKDEIAAFFEGDVPEPTEADYYPMPDFRADNAAPPGSEDNGYEMESLPESAELPAQLPTEDELNYTPPVCDYPQPTRTRPYFEMFDPNAADAWQWDAPPEAAASPAPAYTPASEKTADFAAVKGSGKTNGASSLSMNHSSGRQSSAKKALLSRQSGSGKNMPLKAPPTPSVNGSPNKPPILWSRVVALAAAVVMMIFCGVVGGNIVFHMATNEQVMREVKDAYQEQRGSTMQQDATKVELLPPGVTFEPTASPQPVVTPSPVPRVSIADPAADSLNPHNQTDGQATEVPSATAVVRTRLMRYPNNTLRNVLDSMKDLYAEYPELIGRLTIPGVLDEMVVQRNNTYYLNHNYRGDIADGGAIYADESCSIKIPPENLLLRGQGNVTGKAFAPLWQYQTGGEEFVSGATTATLTTLYEEASYVLMAVIVADSDPASPAYFNYASHPTFTTDQEMMEYVQTAQQKSLYHLPVSIAAEDRLLTLSTVSSGNSSQCLVLLFRMLRNGESLR